MSKVSKVTEKYFEGLNDNVYTESVHVIECGKCKTQENGNCYDDFIFTENLIEKGWTYKRGMPLCKNCSINKPKKENKEVLEFLKKYSTDVEFSKLTIGSDGLYTFSGYVNLSNMEFVELPTTLKYFKHIDYINIYGCENLTSLNGLENLESVFDLHCVGCTSLTDIKALKNLKTARYINFKFCIALEDSNVLKNAKIEAILKIKEKLLI